MTEPAAERQSTEVPAERAGRAESAVGAFAPQTFLVQLQRTAGNQAVARAVARTRSIQRQALDPDKILSAVESSKYLKSKLEASTSAQQRTATKERMRARVEAILKHYKDMFGGADAATDNAMMLALAIGGAAGVIADELYDPGLKGKISEVLFTVYGPKIKANLTKKQGLAKDEARRAVATAKALGSDDPVSLYMHEEMRLEHAAYVVADMAHAARVEPKKMFELLSQRYQAELASFTLKDLEEREHQGMGADKSYRVTEATGEISGAFFKSLLGDDLAKDATKGTAKGGLGFTAGAAAKLDRLRKMVEAGLGTPPPATAERRRKQHFEDLATSDKAIAAGREARVKAWLTKQKKDGGWELDDAKADRVIAKLKAGLPGLPLTITVSGKTWFGDRQGPRTVDPMFKAGTAELRKERLADLIGEKGTKAKKRYGSEKLGYSGKYEHELYGFERGENYLRFRRWKDQLMTQSLGFRPEELPVFGAVNVNWATTWGTEGFGSDKTKEELAARERAGETLTKAQKQRLEEGRAEDKRRQQVEAQGALTGINYYGDTHFLLDPAKVGGRVVYTATDHGRPHLDPFLAFADFLLPTEATESYDGTPYRPDITRLRPGGVTNKAIQMDVINAILDPANAPLVRRGLPFEIQIFGGIDLRTDVTDIYVSPGAPDGVFENATAWAAAFAPRVTVHRIPKLTIPLVPTAKPEERAQAALAKS